MKMVMLIFNETLTSEIEELLGQLDIVNFTEWYPATGCGASGGKHMGDHIFPGHNRVRVMALPDETAARLQETMQPYLSAWKKEGCKLFAWACEELC